MTDNARESYWSKANAGTATGLLRRKPKNDNGIRVKDMSTVPNGPMALGKESRTMRDHIACALTICIGIIAGSGTALGGEHGLDRHAIAAVIRSQRDSIETCRFHFERNEKIIGKAYVEKDPFKNRIAFSVDEYVSDGQKRRVSSRYGKSQEELIEDNMTATWNGNSYKTYSAKMNHGTVDSEPEDDRFFVPFTPIWHAMYTDSTKNGERPDYTYDVVAILESDRCILASETDQVDGVELIVASMGSYKVWLDPARGFAVVRKDAFIGEAPTKLWYSVRNSDFKDCGNGIWLPAQTVSTEYVYKGYPKEDWGNPYREMTFKADVVEVNTQLPHDLFDIVFPTGARISDRALNIDYEAGMSKIEDALDVSPDKFIELQKEESNVGDSESNLPLSSVKDVKGQVTDSGPSFLPWLVVALAVVCAVTSIILIKGARKRREGGTQ